jgi:hypothetical protein
MYFITDKRRIETHACYNSNTDYISALNLLEIQHKKGYTDMILIKVLSENPNHIPRIFRILFFDINRWKFIYHLSIEILMFFPLISLVIINASINNSYYTVLSLIMFFYVMFRIFKT